MTSLSAEEKAVLQWTAVGKPDKAIALRLDLSLRTIQLPPSQPDGANWAWRSCAELIRFARLSSCRWKTRGIPKTFGGLSHSGPLNIHPLLKGR